MSQQRFIKIHLLKPLVGNAFQHGMTMRARRHGQRDAVAPPRPPPKVFKENFYHGGFVQRIKRVGRYRRICELPLGKNFAGTHGYITNVESVRKQLTCGSPRLNCHHDFIPDNKVPSENSETK
jgi:hypothetical protein